MKKSIIDLKCCSFFVFLFFVLYLSFYSTLFLGQNGLTSCSLFTNSTTNFLKNDFEFDSCTDKYIYMHDLPSKFNEQILKNCSILMKFYNMCEPITNFGFGPLLTNSNGILQEKSWYFTDQFTLEIIFHNKMKNYKCLTKNSSLASAIYVPFYAGLDASHYLLDGISAKDAVSLDLIKWLTQRPEWKYKWGQDHFFVTGRIARDFSRKTENESDWGNKLMTLPETKNMTVLSIESSPPRNSVFAIPYPSYFHPSSVKEIFEWQNRVKETKRRYLFCFVGKPRPNIQESIRGMLIKECLASKGNCNLINCVSNKAICHHPIHVMKTFQDSTFCLQPPGDSPTRRSTFDAILSGCIPVFFHQDSAYTQYKWYFPKDYRKYSVFIDENDVRNGKANIEKRLLQISSTEVLAMREEVIKLIPKVLYAYPGSQLETLEDAFDIAIKKVLEQVREHSSQFYKEKA